MVEFIRKEAQEKASEIRAAAEEESAIEKQHITEAETAKIRKDFAAKAAQVESQKKIEYASQLNKERLRVLGARQESVAAVIDGAHVKLAEMAKPGAQYEKILEGLILQGLQRLKGDTAMVVRCRSCDLSMVQQAAPKAAAEFQRLGGGALQGSGDTANHLAPPPGPDRDVEFCSGGVVVTNSNGKIRCDNTLDGRLEVTKQGLLPFLREELFGKVAKSR